MEVEGAAVSNAKVIVNHCPEMQDKIEVEAAEKKAKEKEERQAQITSDLQDELMYVSVYAVTMIFFIAVVKGDYSVFRYHR